MKILITGGAGFIGSNLALYLLKKGHEITILDNLSSGKEENLPDSVRFIKGDICKAEDVETAMKGQEWVVHLAAEVSVIKTIKNPLLAEEVNVGGSINVLQRAKEEGVKKVVLASSAAVYGEEPVTPTPESARPQPMSPYAISKLSMEDYANLYSKQGVQTCTPRFFNVYGPRQDPKSRYSAVIPAFITRALRNEELTIYGDGVQRRDFVFVEDLCRAIELALNSGSGAFNVATGKSITIKELAELIISLTNSKSKINYAPARPGDPRTSLADVSKIKKELGFEPRMTLKDGLKETINFYK